MARDTSIRVPRVEWPPGATPCRFCCGRGFIPVSVSIDGTHGRKMVAWAREDKCCICEGKGYEVIP